MTAVGVALILIGLWVLIRTLVGGLAGTLTRNPKYALNLGSSSAAGATAAGSKSPTAELGGAGADASTPAQAAALTPASLRRAISSGRVSKAQVTKDLKLLYPGLPESAYQG